MTTRSLVIKLILTDKLTSNLDILLLQLEMAEDRCSGSFNLSLSSRQIAVARIMSGGPAGKHAAMTTTMEEGQVSPQKSDGCTAGRSTQRKEKEGELQTSLAGGGLTLNLLIGGI
jgi:hypothetical protein